MYDSNRLPCSGLLPTSPMVLFRVESNKQATINLIRVVNTSGSTRTIYLNIRTNDPAVGPQPVWPSPVTLAASCMASDSDTMILGPNCTLEGTADGAASYIICGKVDNV